MHLHAAAAGIASALLSTTTSKDVRELPDRNKLVLGVTSLWMLLPITHGVLRWSQHRVTQGQLFLIMALTCSCLSSTMFWSDARRGSMFHILDKCSAVLYLACVMFVAATGAGERQLSVKLQVLLPAATIALFVLGDMFFKRRRYDHQLAFHLLFRYLGYWYGHLLLVPEETHFATACLSLSLGYFGHIAGLCAWARTQNVMQSYSRSCVTLLLWVLLCGQVHFLVSYAPEVQ
jgi:hypothetical protein